ncbi:hypothetical protein GCM10007160_23900 [Litchfieldella qijiaojingensis]|uniref:Catalase n=1 Tax=Litchfieldella qijiaojingensis TaxID=980347 RepID=A0ABQ2YW53_9GAMM|nr:catalase family protein [Halomonas qijiaojingensis]GGX95528.1 hypothetical protein GCM10007160_23900 [Halomonas qijiaojingensis]
MVLWLTLLGGCDNSPDLGLGEERVSPEESLFEAEMTRRILEIAREHHSEHPQQPIPRFNQPKTLACPVATFRVLGLDERLAQGIFAEPNEYQAILRFANATAQDDREKDLRGLTIRLFDVDGASSVDGTAGHQDFLLNSHPRLFAGTPEDFHAFVSAVADDRLWWYFLNPLDPHLKSLWIAWQARSQPDSLLAIRYWSTTPYRYGEDESVAVKYSVRPCPDDTPQDRDTEGPDGDDPHYLRHTMAENLRTGEACLSFMVQFQTDPDSMPIEDASVTWDEEDSPFEEVARLTLPRQDVTAPQALSHCEGMAFNPWNTHPAHRPLGGINRVRRGLYQEVGEFRTSHDATLSATPDGP